MVLMQRQVRAAPDSVAAGSAGRVASTVRTGSFRVRDEGRRSATGGSRKLSPERDAGEPRL